uniref:Uncharacterized protein n=1 Tax=Myotis myotis TaxID=51298 RepID=A0A7J7ZYG3_MYOMY|nr:hypothetical protein mMyoMyo1_009991 [Myotis myotis]
MSYFMFFLILMLQVCLLCAAPPLQTFCPKFELPRPPNSSVGLPSVVRLRLGLSSLGCGQNPFQAQILEGVSASFRDHRPEQPAFQLVWVVPDHCLPWSLLRFEFTLILWGVCSFLNIFLLVSERKGEGEREKHQ